VLAWGAETLLFPWRGDRIMNTLAVVLASHGLVVGQDGLALTIGNCTPVQLASLIEELAVAAAPDPLVLARQVRSKAHEKYDRYLSEDLLDVGYAARALDVPGAWSALVEIAAFPTVELSD